MHFIPNFKAKSSRVKNLSCFKKLTDKRKKIRRQCNSSSCQWRKNRTSSGDCSELRGVLAVFASFSLALPARIVACVSICCCYVLLMSSLTKPKLMMPPLCCTLCWVSAFHQATSIRCQSAEPLYAFSHCCCGSAVVVAAFHGKWRKFIQNFCIRLNFKTMFMQQATKAAGKCNIRNERGAEYLCGTHTYTHTHTPTHMHLDLLLKFPLH